MELLAVHNLSWYWSIVCWICQLIFISTFCCTPTYTGTHSHESGNESCGTQVLAAAFNKRANKANARVAPVACYQAAALRTVPLITRYRTTHSYTAYWNCWNFRRFTFRFSTLSVFYFLPLCVTHIISHLQCQTDNLSCKRIFPVALSSYSCSTCWPITCGYRIIYAVYGEHARMTGCMSNVHKLICVYCSHNDGSHLSSGTQMLDCANNTVKI